MIPVRPIVALTAVALVAAGCGSSSPSGKTGTNSASNSPAAKTTPAATPPKATTGQAPAVSNAKNLAQKPKIAKPGGNPPATLIKKDLVVGKGPVLKSGQTATVQYVGISWSNGKQFDASWDRGQPISFPIGVGQVIPGWDKGVPGMRVGGRRELVIPPAQGYGPAGSPPAIGPNETLVFVIDLKKAG
ncbi:MAG: peptidylprolyl isomerase [Solirubrobacteraceae bacterium]|nr:peptidylprolyl isomerase [Solirubrobacteraceae bacterium]